MKARYERAQAFLFSLADNCPDLPFEPTLLPELFASTSAGSTRSITDITALVERSPGLAARILRTANSAYYGIQTVVSSLSHAIQLLGIREVRAIILQLGIASTFRNLPLPESFPAAGLWEHQLLTAHLARLMANALSLPGGDTLYAAGLLHDLGKTMVAAHCPEDWQRINELAAEQSLPFHAAEESYWGIDHAVAGSRILTFWGLPADLTELVSWHHAPQQAEKHHIQSASLLSAANELAAHLAALSGDDAAAALAEKLPALLPDPAAQTTLLQHLADGRVLIKVRNMAAGTLQC